MERWCSGFTVITVATTGKSEDYMCLAEETSPLKKQALWNKTSVFLRFPRATYTCTPQGGILLWNKQRAASFSHAYRQAGKVLGNTMAMGLSLPHSPFFLRTSQCQKALLLWKSLLNCSLCLAEITLVRCSTTNSQSINFDCLFPDQVTSSHSCVQTFLVAEMLPRGTSNYHMGFCHPSSQAYCYKQQMESGKHTAKLLCCFCATYLIV